MEKVVSLMLACCVFFSGCDTRNPVAASLPDNNNDDCTVVEAPVCDMNNPQEVSEQIGGTREPDVIFVATPQDVVDKMLELAKVRKDDLVYDLGCGDGRIVVTAAKRYGCKAIGYDIDPQRVEESLENVAKNNVGHLVRIEQKDIFTLDLSEANVITLYLLPSLNVKLIPQLEKLRPGSRIVSHDFDMSGVEPDMVITITASEDNAEHQIYLWTTPLKKTEIRIPAYIDTGLLGEIQIPDFEIEPVLEPSEGLK